MRDTPAALPPESKGVSSPSLCSQTGPWQFSLVSWWPSGACIFTGSFKRLLGPWGDLVDNPKERPGQGGQAGSSANTIVPRRLMKSLGRPPRVPTSKAHTGGPPPALGAILVLVRIPSPFLPFPATRDPWGPALHAGSSPRNFSCPAALSSTSGPCCHGNSGKAGSFLQGQWEREGGRGPAWPLQHPPSTRSPCRCSLPPGFSAVWPLPSPCPHPESWHHPAPATVLNVLGLDSQASRMLTPPLPSSSRSCIQQMLPGHLISIGLRARRWSYGGNQGGPAPAISELRVRSSGLPQIGLSEVPGSQHFIISPKVPAATQLEPGRAM